jgi:hypothetical protein
MTLARMVSICFNKSVGEEGLVGEQEKSLCGCESQPTSVEGIFKS